MPELGYLSRKLDIWIRKVLYSLLIFWVCGVGPLIYFESFSSHRGARGYQPIILGKSARPRQLPPELVQALKRYLDQTPANWVIPFRWTNTYQVVTYTTPYFTSIFGDGYGLLVIQSTPLDNFSFFGPASILSYGGSSIWLPPPKKPPPFCQMIVTQNYNKFTLGMDG